MKTSNPILRVAACGLAALILSLAPAAHAALTAAQISALGGSGSAGPTSAAVAALFATATTPDAKKQLAKDIAAYVAVNYPTSAGSICGQLAKLDAASAVEIVRSAVGANKAVTAAVVESVVREVKGTPGAPAAIAVAVIQIDVQLGVTAAQAATKGVDKDKTIAASIISNLVLTGLIDKATVTYAVNQVVTGQQTLNPVGLVVNPLGVSTSS